MSLARILVPLLAAAAGIGGGLLFMQKVGPDVSGARTDANGQTVGQPVGPRPKVNGGDEQSMLRPEQFAKAMAIVRKEAGGKGGRVSEFRLAPERLDVNVDGDGKQIDLELIPGGRIYYRSVSQGSNSFPADDLVVGDIRNGAPWRIVRTMQSQSGVAPDDIDYMVLSRYAVSGRGKGQWGIYLKNIHGSYYRAAFNGAHPTRCC